MKMRTIISRGILAAAILILALCRPAPALASSTVTVSSAGNGVFLLQGIGIEGAAALEIIVSYDTATLANPRVVAGPLITGAMTAINPNVPGIVRMVMICLTPVKGSGVIATMTFDLRGSSPGKIISLSARFANSQGAPLPVLVQVINPSETPTMASDMPQSQESTAGTAETPQIIAPTIIIAKQPDKPGEANGEPDMQGKKEPDDRPVPPEPDRRSPDETAVPTQETDIASAAGAEKATDQSPGKNIYTQKSILDRFREYRGMRMPGAFVSLFKQGGMFWCRQDPAVALSDGKTAVRVTFISTPGNKTSSDIAVMGARLISLKKDPDNTNTWIVELMPERGEYRASIAVSQGAIKMIYPLTIAPEITPGHSRSGGITQAEFYQYFSRQEKSAQIGFDTNKDGRRDYLDDYIVTANYLAATEKRIAGK